MEIISLDKDKQNEVKKRVKKIKKGLKSKRIILRENVGKKISKKRVKRSRKGRATIYLGHIPHGFYENEMTAYFSQFGKVLSATVARSKKTGRSRGFAFIEFLNEDVAKIAAETMNNYLMFNRILKCRYIPPEERKGHKLRKIDPLNYPRKKNRIVDVKRKNESVSQMTKEAYKKKAEKKIEDIKKFFSEKGIDFSLKVNSDEISKTVRSSDKSSCEAPEELDVLEIDESDNEIQFTTPPNVRKIIRKSLSSKKAESERGKRKTPSVNSEKKSAITRKKNVKNSGIDSIPEQSKSSSKLIKNKKMLVGALKRKNLAKGKLLEPSESAGTKKSKTLKGTAEAVPDKKAKKCKKTTSNLVPPKPKKSPVKRKIPKSVSGKV